MRSSFIIFSLVISLNIWAKDIAPKKKYLDTFNSNLDSKKFKEAGYTVFSPSKKPRSKFYTKEEIEKGIQILKAQKYTKNFDILGKQIFIHRVVNHSLKKLQLYYPNITQKEFIEMKGRIK